VGSTYGKPSPTAEIYLRKAKVELDKGVAMVNTLIQEDLAAFKSQFQASGVVCYLRLTLLKRLKSRLDKVYKLLLRSLLRTRFHVTRMDKGVIKVRAKSSWEIQLDSQTGDILQVAYRRSDFIESLHDGTFFQKSANLWLMLPSALGLFTLLVTGLVLFFQPYIKKYKKRTKRRNR
jgi:hypothetical protein